jgi:competence protein ComEA
MMYIIRSRQRWLTWIALLALAIAPRVVRAEPPSAACACPRAESAGEDGDPARGPIDLNDASEEKLQSLPGIGPARARAILAYRAAHGGFRSISQLLQIRGIGRALLKQLRPLVTLSLGGASHEARSDASRMAPAAR